VCLLAAPASAGIIYTMTNASGLQNVWALSGTITVSGTGTDLGSADITSWAYTVTDGSASHTYSSSDQSAQVVVRGLLATPTQLIVKYASNNVFQTNVLDLFSGVQELAWNTGGSGNPQNAKYLASGFWNNSSRNLAFPSTTADGWVIGTVSSSPVPEIDPAMGGSALSLVAGVLAMIEQRRRRATLVA